MSGKDETTPDVRERPFTERGREQFETVRQSQRDELSFATRVLTEMVQDFEKRLPKSLADLDYAEDNLERARKRYSNCASQFVAFLTRYNSTEKG